MRRTFAKWLAAVALASSILACATTPKTPECKTIEIPPAEEVKPPRSVERPMPRVGGIPGPEFKSVCLEIVVEPDGSVGDVRMVRSVNPDFDRAVLDAVRRWRFEPATRDGVPVRFPMNLTISSWNVRG